MSLPAEVSVTAMEELEFVPPVEEVNGACEPVKAPEEPLPSGDGPKPKHEDLAARAIVPVKAEYLRLVSSRSSSNLVDRKKGDGGQEVPVPPPKVVVAEKKSKRQMKRERQQEQKSSKNICPEIAKTGKVDACRFGGSCRFSHDLEGFLLQKSDDLPGVCPFMDIAQSCPYGLACRFYGSHKEFSASDSPDHLPKYQGELNFLNKDFQRLLWKNKVKFPKADAQLKALGLSVGKNPKPNADNALGQNPAEANESNDYDALSESEACLKPSKKMKNLDGDAMSSVEFHNGSAEESMLTNLWPGIEVEIIPKLNGREKKIIDFRGKPYLAPLTTVGNLPFRRICKGLGADITCGEMAMCTNLLQGQASEWALLRRHQSEDIFGVQICGSYPDTVSRTVELIEQQCCVDFIDINMGCPIDVVVNKGAGSSLLTKPMRMKSIVQAASGTTNLPLTLKVRTGFFEGRNRIDSLIDEMGQWGMTALTIHGRSRQQRYSKLADWDYIYDCVGKGPDNLQIIGNGDIFSYVDWNKRIAECPQLSSCMIARGALIKPWIFTEIKEQRHWDISSGERLDILKDFVKFGLQHWGSDNKGVETTRHFLLEWLSYTHRYVPVGILEVVPQRLNWRPPSYFGRDDLETLMASESAADWIHISEMLLGKVPDGFSFAPKHKSNAYDRAENG